MLHQNSKDSKILLTTPDYPPKLGGLSTYSKSIERSLARLGKSYDVLVWNSPSELKNAKLPHSYDFAFHVHFFGSHYLKKFSDRHINFIHGSEILFTSPNMFKRTLKKIMKPLFLSSIESCQHNIFISEFTQNKLNQLGLKLDYARDIIFHNCIDMSSSRKNILPFDEGPLKLISVARDVPHKNLNFCFDVAKEIARETSRNVELYISKNIPSGDLVKVIDISGISDEKRNEILANCHFNLLLSLDHSKRGFYEGFGLTVLEAASFGTPSIVSSYGGLPEACHHNVTGWVLPLKLKNFSRLVKNLHAQDYQKISQAAYDHVTTSHDDELYDKLLQLFLKESHLGH